MMRKSRFFYSITCTVIVWTFLRTQWHQNDKNAFKSRVPLAITDEKVIDCVPPGIDSFPSDFLTQEQRKDGGVVIHILIVCYTCAMTAIVCDQYFVPALEAIASKLQLSPDVAGATFMAMGASAPELFSSLAGSFITEDDIGLGTILGSAVFNILGISGIVGISLKSEALTIQKYPVIRDCIVYGLTVIVLGYVISDNVVMWWEALILLVIFFSYIVLMHFNRKIEKATKKLQKWLFSNKRGLNSNSETDPLLENQKGITEVYVPQNPGPSDNITEKTESNPEEVGQPEPDEPPCFCISVCHIVMWIPSLLFRATIPPVRYYPITFVVSIAWMGALSYITVWMVTVIGFTLSIPDSVAGLTLLAAGSSVPDLIATVLIARTGEGNMAVSNLLGSNTFDLAFCLGLPWFIKTLISKRRRLFVYSSAMVYTTATLLLNLFALIMTFYLTGWRLNRKSGIVCLVLYFLFITLACLYELNVFGEVNLPTCS